MKKLVVYSLWGKDRKYGFGAIRNAEINQEIYPEFISQFHVDLTVPRDIIYDLEDIPNVEIVTHPVVGDWTFSMNRFLSFADPTVEIFLSRDCDSRPSLRERSAVDEWMKSGKSFHIMRDHPRHGNYPILAGMFASRGGIIENYHSLLNSFNKINYYHTDQDFLRKCVFPVVKGDCVIHDEFFEKKPFPLPRNGTEFIGDVFDENDQRSDEFWRELGVS